MVFYSPPKRQQRAPNQKTSITHLPDETLLQILQDVPTSAVLKLRTVCSCLVAACTTTIQKRLTTLYIHPGMSSLRTAVAVCSHPLYSQQIDEIILLGKVLWPAISKEYLGIRNCRRPEQAYGPGSAAHAWRSRFRPWPLHFLEAVRTPLEHEFESLSLARALPDSHPTVASFEQSYSTLIAALVELPKLKKISFADSVERPGFNQTSQQCIDAHAKKSANALKEPFGLSENALNLKRPKQSVVPRRADADVFFGLLLNSRLRFTEMCLKSEMPFIEHVTTRLEYSAPPNRLTQIEVHVDCGWAGSNSQRLYHSILRASSPTLTHVKLAFIPNSTFKKASHNCEQSIVNILDQLTFPQFKCLQLEQLKRTSEKFEDGPHERAHAYRHPRPLCAVFDILGFLQRHESTIAGLRFENIFFSTPSIGAPTFRLNVVETTQAVLEFMEQIERLSSFAWIIGRFDHEPRCKRADTEPFIECTKYECGVVGAGLETTDLEILASRLHGVEYDKETRTWDFGQYIMRAKEKK